jgi:hypothetical protein
MTNTSIAKILTHWRLVTENGYLYVYGRLHGRAWETSYVTSMYSTENFYVIYTENSVYYLYYDDSKK